MHIAILHGYAATRLPPCTANSLASNVVVASVNDFLFSSSFHRSLRFSCVSLPLFGNENVAEKISIFLIRLPGHDRWQRPGAHIGRCARDGCTSRCNDFYNLSISSCVESEEIIAAMQSGSDAAFGCAAALRHRRQLVTYTSFPATGRDRMV